MKNKKNIIKIKKQTEFDFDDNYQKYYWLIIPILTLIYYIFSLYSNGFYQDDEVAHFINMRDFWTDPSIIMSNWGKPGWKIFLVVPALFGVKTVFFVNSFFTALTAYFTILLAKELKIKNSILAGILFAFQPLILQLSFRSYAEIFTGLTLVLSLYFFFKENYNMSALFCGLSFTARQETALLSFILIIYFLHKKKYPAILLLGVFPFLLNLLGYFHTGDFIWIISEMRSLGELNMGVERSFFHYFEMYIYIIGPVVFLLFILGLIKPFYDSSFRKDYFNRYNLIYSFFLIIFIFQCYLVAKGTNPGSWRYVLQASPFAGIIACIGFNDTLNFKRNKNIIYSVITVLFLIFIFLSKQPTGLVTNPITDYTNIGFALLLCFIIFIPIYLVKNNSIQKVTVILVLLLTIGFSFYSEKPRQPTPENVTISNLSEWYNNNIDKSRKVLYNHSLIIYYSNAFGEQRQKFSILNHKSLSEALPGTIIIWDSHYSYRPEYKNDTKLEDLQNNDNYKLLNQFQSSDNRFNSFIYEKK